MGASLQNPDVKNQLDKLQNDTVKASSDLKWELAQSAVDAAGLVDPTPISDAIGAVMSAARGDWFGAGMSLVSMLPYAGDAIGKTAKGAKVLARIASLRKRIADNVVRGRQIVANALKQDAAAIRAKRTLKKGEKIEEGIIKGCPVGGNRFGTQSPKEGWVSGERGSGTWDPSKSGLKKDSVDDIESVTGGKPIEWENGNPSEPPRWSQARPRHGQSQVLQNGAYPTGYRHVRQNPSPASTSHAGEHVQVERPSEQLGPIHSWRPLLQQLLAGRCLGRLVRLLLTCLGECASPGLGDSFLHAGRKRTGVRHGPEALVPVCSLKQGRSRGWRRRAPPLPRRWRSRGRSAQPRLTRPGCCAGGSPWMCSRA